eukprot:COSAG02_NODE_254_length_26937_cov_16.503950_27_plen_47_part_00
MTRERTLRRLEQYMKQGMSKDDALAAAAGGNADTQYYATYLVCPEH